MKIAIYSANFGNYRNEIKYLNNPNIKFDEKIDYFFFTDKKDIKLNEWKVIYTPLKEQSHYKDKSRATSKYIKWIIPEILKAYDIIIWIDTKPRNLKGLKFTHSKIMNFINTPYGGNFSTFFIKHRRRKKPEQELRKTIKTGQENKKYGLRFLRKIKKQKYEKPLPDTTCIIIKNTPDNIKVMRNCYDNLIKYKLYRDQNIIQYTWKVNNHESKVGYFKMDNLKE